MKPYTIALAAALFSGSALAETFESCVLDEMPGVANDVAAHAVYRDCNAHPSAVQGSGRGLFGYASGDACIKKEARDTPSVSGARFIHMACYRLYNEPSKFDPSTARGFKIP